MLWTACVHEHALHLEAAVHHDICPTAATTTAAATATAIAATAATAMAAGIICEVNSSPTTRRQRLLVSRLTAGGCYSTQVQPLARNPETCGSRQNIVEKGRICASHVQYSDGVAGAGQWAQDAIDELASRLVGPESVIAAGAALLPATLRLGRPELEVDRLHDSSRAAGGVERCLHCIDPALVCNRYCNP